jgi:hypothetical protein
MQEVLMEYLNAVPGTFATNANQLHLHGLGITLGTLPVPVILFVVAVLKGKI